MSRTLNKWVLHFIWLDVMMLRWLCCNADWMLLLVLFKLMGVVETSDEACDVVMLFAFDVFVCSCALEDEVVVTTAVTAVSATVDVAVLLSFHKTEIKESINERCANAWVWTVSVTIW